MSEGDSGSTANSVTGRSRNLPRATVVIVMGSILLTTALALLWTTPWTVLRGNADIAAADASATYARSLSTPALGFLDCSTASPPNLWLCWGDVTYRDASGSIHRGRLLLTDHDRKACVNSDPGTQATQYPKGCDYLNAVYDTRNPEAIALANGNPTPQERRLGFAQLLLFPTLIASLATGIALAGIVHLMGERRGWWMQGSS
jgi:hypothetical protein